MADGTADGQGIAGRMGAASGRHSATATRNRPVGRSLYCRRHTLSETWDEGGYGAWKTFSRHDNPDHRQGRSVRRGCPGFSIGGCCETEPPTVQSDGMRSAGAAGAGLAAGALGQSAPKSKEIDALFDRAIVAEPKQTNVELATLGEEKSCHDG